MFLCRTFIILLIALGIQQHLTAQEVYFDSLRTEIVKANEDINKVKLLIELAYQYRRINPDSALLLVAQGQELALNLDFYKGKFGALRIKGMIHFNKEQLDSAMIYFRLAEELANKNNDRYNLSNLYNNMATVYRQQNKQEEALESYQKSLALKKELGDLSGQVVAINNIGNIYVDRRDYDQAISLFNEGLILAEELNHKAFQGGLLRNLARLYNYQSKHTEAIDFYKRALKIRKELDDKEQQGLILSFIGSIYKNQGKYTQALSYYQQSLSIREKLANKNLMAKTLNLIGTLYNELKDYDQAIDYFTQALNIQEELGYKSDQANSLHSIGVALISQEKYDEALPYVMQTIQIRKTLGADYVLAVPYANIGRIYERQNRIDSAIFYTERGLEIAEKSKSLQTQSICKYNLGLIYQKRGEYAKAINNLEETISLARQTTFPKKEAEASAALYEIYKHQQNFQEALRYHEQYQRIQDTLFNEENAKELGRIQADYEFEQEKQQLAFEQEKAELSFQQKLRRQQSIQWAIIGLLGLAFIFILVIIRYYQLKRKANIVLGKLNEEIREQKSVVEQQKDELLELDRIKSNFFANVSHELRTPLTLILGPLDAIVKKYYGEVDHQLKGALMNIQRNSKRLLVLVEEILDLSKLESGKMRIEEKPIHFSSFVKRIFAAFESTAELKSIRYWVDYELAQDLHLLLDENKVEKILYNLLSNALKFTPTHGTIHLLVNEDAGTNRIKIRVKDTGKGISKKDLPHIFERFFQTKNPRASLKGGTGIGLALSYELAQIIGGELSVESKEGKGSSFILEIPRKEVHGQGSPLPENASVLPITEGFSQTIKAPEDAETLLLVEDNPDMQQFIHSILSPHFHLLVANHGREALELLEGGMREERGGMREERGGMREERGGMREERGEMSDERGEMSDVQSQPNSPINPLTTQLYPSLIISDVMMPEMDGFELLDRLKSSPSYAQLPIIMLTARANEQDKLHALRVGVDDYLTKPFLPEELLVRIRNLLIHYQERNSVMKANNSSGPSGENEEKVIVQRPQFSQEDQIWLKKLEQITLREIDKTNFKLSDLEEELAVSGSKLSRKVKALTGLTPNLYVRETKLHKARQLLEAHTYSTLAEYAYAVGFKDPHYFSSLFEKRFGKKVKEYLG